MKRSDLELLNEDVLCLLTHALQLLDALLRTTRTRFRALHNQGSGERSARELSGAQSVGASWRECQYSDHLRFSCFLHLLGETFQFLLIGS